MNDMRTYDFAPLYRATVGFDQIADLMDRVLTDTSATASYPPYNDDGELATVLPTLQYRETG